MGMGMGMGNGKRENGEGFKLGKETRLVGEIFASVSRNA
jgi:hypothetical protein